MRMKALIGLLLALLLINPSSLVMANSSNEENTKYEASHDTLTKEERKELKFREEFGLKNELNVVKESIEKHSIGKYGVHLSPEEELQIDERILFQQETNPKLLKILTEEFDDEFTLYIDQKTNGTYHIGVKNKIANIDKIQDLFKENYNFKVYSIEYSEKDLDIVMDDIIENLDYLEKNNIIFNSAYTDVINEKVHIAIENYSNEHEKLLINYFGNTIVVEQAEESADDNRASTFSVMRGGAKITYKTDSWCTVGFMLERASDSKKFVATAGHCIDYSVTNYKQGSTDLGNTKYSEYGSHADIGYIGYGPSTVTYTGGKIYVTATTSTYYDRAQNASEDVVGDAVCMSGASMNTNPVSCGTLNSKNLSWTVNGTNFTKLRQATYTSTGGDSGGTVYGGTTLKGVNKGHKGSYGVYSQLELAMDAIYDKYGTTFYILF